MSALVTMCAGDFCLSDSPVWPAPGGWVGEQGCPEGTWGEVYLMGQPVTLGGPSRIPSDGLCPLVTPGAWHCMEGLAGCGQLVHRPHLVGCPLRHVNRRVTGRPSLCLTLRSEGKQEVPAAQKSPGLAWNVGWAAASWGLKRFCHRE